MYRRPIAGLAIAFVLWAAGAAAEPMPWPDTLVNPKPAPEDLVLPMPCGGAMAFRRIDVPGESPLDDRRVILGGNDPRFAAIENSRSEYVAGGFQDRRKKTQRFFYLGKYEVTALQVASFGRSCPAASPEGRLPKVNVTWAEAIAFAAEWSAWLVKNAPDRLPKEDGAPGFVRLPTEVEWEFAARGGIAVSDADFQLPVFTMAGSPAEYVWYQGTESANNELNGIGLLKPNPLGLHDMLGNAGEFVLDPFRLNKLSRLHGQSGGQLVKGGDYRTPLADIRAAARVEFPPIDVHGERRSPGTGFRVALVPPSLSSAQRFGQIRQAWTNLAESPATPLAPQQDDPVKEAEALVGAIDDGAIKTRIQNLATVIKANIQTRNEQRDRAARSELRAGSFLRVMMRNDFKQKIEVRREQLQLQTLGDALKVQIEQALKRDEEALLANVDFYIDSAVRLSGEYPEAVISAQAEILKRELEVRNRLEQIGHVDAFVADIAQLRGGRRLDSKMIVMGFR